MGLRDDIAAGYTQSLIELVHGEVFSDFMEMAQYLLHSKFKDPAAVLAGSTLEAHIRKLCEKNGVSITINGKPTKCDKLNADLAKENVYSKLDQKQITAWLDLRNKAAHGKYGEYTEGQVTLLISGVMNFITRNPA